MTASACLIIGMLLAGGGLPSKINYTRGVVLKKEVWERTIFE